MEKILLMLSVIILLGMNSCTKEKQCHYRGNLIIRGEKGGCYYINSKGNKDYIDRSYCDCEGVNIEVVTTNGNRN